MLTVKDFEARYLGHKFGKLTVTGKAASEKRQVLFVKVRCDCGNEKEMLLNNLVYGFSKSCGCERVLAVSKRLRDSSKLTVMTPDGSKSITQLSKENGVRYGLIYDRYMRGERDLQKLLETRSQGGHRPRKPDPRLNGLSNIVASEQFGIPKQLVSDRLKRGWIVNSENQWVTPKGKVLTRRLLKIRSKVNKKK